MQVMPQDLWWKKIGAQPFSHAPYAYVRIDLVFQRRHLDHVVFDPGVVEVIELCSR